MKTAREFAIALAATDLGSNIVAIAERDREVRAAALREAAQAVDGMVVGVLARAQRLEEEASKVLFDVSKELRELADRAECGE